MLMRSAELLIIQEFGQFLYSNSAMADGIFFYRTHLPKSLVVSIWDEYRIIAKSLIPSTFVNNTPLNMPLKKVLLTILVKRYNSLKSRLPLIIHYIRQLLEHQVNICFHISRTRISRRINSRLST